MKLFLPLGHHVNYYLRVPRRRLRRLGLDHNYDDQSLPSASLIFIHKTTHDRLLLLVVRQVLKNIFHLTFICGILTHHALDDSVSA